MTKTEQVFISYAAEDAQFAHRLADDLQRLGIQVWIAPENIRPGESWVSAIERGLRESSHTVVVLTPAALESKWVKKETDVTIAQERKGRIQVIPLYVEPCEVPLLLSSYQMVSFHGDYDAGLSQLADILGVRAAESLKKIRRPEEEERQKPTKRMVEAWREVLARLGILKYLIGAGVVVALAVVAVFVVLNFFPELPSKFAEFPQATSTSRATEVIVVPPTATLTPSRTPRLPTATPLPPTEISTSTPTETNTSTPTETNTSTPTETSTPKLTKTPTATYTPTPTKTPTPIPPLTPSPIPCRLSLVSPPDGTSFGDETSVVTLQWQFGRALAPDEYFFVSITYLHNGQTWYDGTWVDAARQIPSGTRDTSWELDDYLCAEDLSDTGCFDWNVAIKWREGDNPDLGDEVKCLSPTWSFCWTGCEKKPTSTPGGPTPTSTPPTETPTGVPTATWTATWTPTSVATDTATPQPPTATWTATWTPTIPATNTATAQS